MTATNHHPEQIDDSLDDLFASDDLSLPEKVAEENWQAQKQLFHELREAKAVCSAPTSLVASKLGWSEKRLRDVLEGHVDLSLSDVRELGYALEAVISYRVTPATLQRLPSKTDADDFLANLWRPMPQKSDLFA